MNPGGRVTLVLGGARSGKSRFAEGLVRHQAGGRAMTYLATAQAGDEEMAVRIARHQADRGPGWRTVEEPLALPETLRAAGGAGPVLVECLTLWLANLMFAERDVGAAGGDLLAALAEAGAPVVVVSNEVGWGVVPNNALARRFADEQGRLNQRVAGLAHEVFLIAAGLPLRLKPSPYNEPPAASEPAA